MVRDIRARSSGDHDEIGAFGRVLLAEFMLAGASAGITDVTIRADGAAVAGLRGVADHENF